jgi:flagellar basal-body rod protein FlgG
MMATMDEMNTVANNLANVNTDGYKYETSVLKAFPEMMIRRTDADGLVTFPLGSYDLAPMVGTLGTGVEFNESYVRFEQGSLQTTDNQFDFALEGQGFFAVQTADGERYTRSGNFDVSSTGFLVDMHGNYVLGQNGPIRVGMNNFKIDQDGNIYVNADYQPEDFTTMTGNEWQNMVKIDTLKLVDFEHRDYLKKDATHSFKSTQFSGPATILQGGPSAERPPRAHSKRRT